MTSHSGARARIRARAPLILAYALSALSCAGPHGATGEPRVAPSPPARIDVLASPFAALPAPSVEGRAQTGTRRAIALAAGGAHTCAVLEDGAVACWGAWGDGVLVGEKSRETREEKRALPRLVPGVTARGLAMGSRSICALGVEATKCWGERLHFLVNGAPVVGTTETPRSFPGLSGATEVSIGAELGCALAADGSLLCWGETVRARVRPADQLAPFVMPAGTGVAKAISVGGDDHACLLASDAKIYCWGANDFGQLGLGDTKARATPAAPAVGLTGVSQLAAGHGITCAVHGGTLSCWGGQGCKKPHTPSRADCMLSPITHARPQPIDGLAPVRAVAVPSVSIITVLLVDGGVVQVDAAEALQRGRADVKPIAGVAHASAVAAGLHHACAIVAEGRVVCWGANENGQVGDGTLGDRESATEVALGQL